MAKTKSRTAAKKSGRTYSRSKKNQSFLSRVSLKDKRVFGGIVILVALVGVALVGLSSAASTNFEAETADKSSTVVVGSDTNASGGKYVQFNVAEKTTTTGNQRFPGDPNPRVNNKAYWGTDEMVGTNFASRHENPAGKSMSVARRFWSSWGQRSQLADEAKTDIAKNRLPMYSIKPVGWTEMASGSRDAEIDAFLRDLDSVGSPIWLIIHHEPDGGGGCKCGPRKEDDPSGAAGWVKMQQKFRERMNRVGTKNVALMAAMTGGWGSDLNQPKDNWWAPNTFDGWFIDLYYYSIEKQALATKNYWADFAKWAEGKDMPYGTAELGIRSNGRDGEGYYTNSSTCSSLTPRGVSAELDQLAGQRLREFWEWGFKNNKDVIAHAYFDQCINSGSSPYTLGGEQLRVFHDILGRDGRVMRVNELGSGGSTTTIANHYGTVSGTVSVPSKGTYKLWVRMQAPDTTNNAVEVQVGDGSVLKVGNGALSANTWTWVDWNNGTKSNKNTLDLEGGNHSVNIKGIEKGVKVDKILVTNETCVPNTVSGSDCTEIAPEEPTPPSSTESVTIAAPANGATLSGTVKVKMNITGEASFVSFRPNNTFAEIVEQAPFEWDWDTTTLSDGTHTLVTRTSFKGDSGKDYTESKITVTINNSQPVESVDTTPPAKPTNIQTSVGFDFTSLKCQARLNWQSSRSSDVAGYKITREGLNTKTSALTYADNGLEVGKTYTYSVSAYDVAGNTSPAEKVSVKYNQFLWWCWFE